MQNKLALLLMVLFLFISTVSCTGQQLFATTSWSPIVQAGEHLAMGTKKGELIIFDHRNGAQIGKCLTGEGRNGTQAIYGTPVFHEGSIFVGGFDGSVYKIPINSVSNNFDEQPCPLFYDPEPGTNTDPFIGGAAIINNTLLISSESGRLYGLNIATGIPVWNTPFKSNGKTWDSPTINNEMLFIGTLNGTVHALDIDTIGGTFQEVWQFQADAGIGSISLDGNTLYISAFDNRLYSLNINTGEPMWLKPFEANNWFWASPLVYEGKLYAPSLDSTIYVLDQKTGNLHTSIQTGGAIRGSAGRIDDMIVVANEEGEIWWIDSQTLHAEAGGKLPEPNYAPVMTYDEKYIIHAEDDIVLTVTKNQRIPTKIFPLE
jgi:outer membrane protein assembly factor BamB